MMELLQAGVFRAASTEPSSLMSLSAPFEAARFKLKGHLESSLIPPARKARFSDGRVWFSGRVRASAERSQGSRVNGVGEQRGFSSSAMEMDVSSTTFNQSSFSGDWDRLGAVVRLSYGVGIYGAMALAGNFICSITGVDCVGGFHPSLEAILAGLGYASPPIMALLFILDDEVVKLSPHARAIRDVEDEELRSFFYGMSPWQFILIITASSVGEELFYRVAVQVSTSIVRKYCGPIDIWFSIHYQEGEMHCLLNGHPKTSFLAMAQHESQWVWFRKLFVIFSSYTYVNTLRKIKPY